MKVSHLVFFICLLLLPATQYAVKPAETLNTPNKEVEEMTRKERRAERKALRKSLKDAKKNIRKQDRTNSVWNSRLFLLGVIFILVGILIGILFASPFSVIGYLASVVGLALIIWALIQAL